MSVQAPGLPTSRPKSALAQDSAHGADHDYEPGSPHLRGRIVGDLERLVADQFRRRGHASVLEIGAGHGQFTDHLLAFGATVTATEMSRTSADRMAGRYANNPAAEVVYDADGGAVGALPEQFGMLFAASVLHHIPDYLSAIRAWLPSIAPGGSFYSVADPILYARQSAATRLAHQSSFYSWRLAQPGRFDAARSNLRRRSKGPDETRETDMVEYHVLRDGVDENAIVELLTPAFESVRVWRYWSTPSALLQRAGERWAAPTNFAIIAEGRR